MQGHQLRDLADAGAVINLAPEAPEGIEGASSRGGRTTGGTLRQPTLQQWPIKAPRPMPAQGEVPIRQRPYAAAPTRQAPPQQQLHRVEALLRRGVHIALFLARCKLCRPRRSLRRGPRRGRRRQGRPSVCCRWCHSCKAWSLRLLGKDELLQGHEGLCRLLFGELDQGPGEERSEVVVLKVRLCALDDCVDACCDRHRCPPKRGPV
mmetsp:Transcript_21057/g.44930  ORF Transcript_21057/g.44930 Transcript_21057/m.44930 type:complete len:207 (-) Transcript_21057:32-652(-)